MEAWVGVATGRVQVMRSLLGNTWDAARRLFSRGKARLALFRKRRRLSKEAIGILLETARAGERDFPETLSGRAAVDELLDPDMWRSSSPLSVHPAGKPAGSHRGADVRYPSPSGHHLRRRQVGP